MRLTVRRILHVGQEGGKRLLKEMPTATTTEMIGKVTYIVQMSASPEAKDTIAQKIKKGIKRDMEKAEVNL